MRKKKTDTRSSRKGASRLARTLRSLLYIVILGVVLAVYNAVTLRRDISVAVGPAGPTQRQFFKDAADRPDIASFFKNLKPAQRLAMSRNIGRYNDRELASLCGKCLDTFDVAARTALTASLAHVALAHPDAVAEQFKLPGSFQQLAIAAALRQAGTSSLPLVDKQLKVHDARPNAVAYLVAWGPEAIAPTLPYLTDPDLDTRLAAADTLGKIRAKEAVPKLVELYRSSPESERLTYLTALAAIGEPSTEDLMATALKNEALPTPHRAQAALGLGQIKSRSALTLLWSYTDDPDHSLRDSAITALQLAGDESLRLEPALLTGAGEARLQVAGGVRSELADSIIKAAIGSPATTIQAAREAANRPELVPAIAGQIAKLNADTEGNRVDALLRSLTTTAPGRDFLEKMETKNANGALGALAARRLALSR